MTDEEIGDLEDHYVPADLLELYEILEYTGEIVPPKAPPKIKSLSGDQRIVSRAACRLRPPERQTSLSDPQGNTTHWHGTKLGDFPHTSCATKVRGIQAFHMDSRGWSDIAYTSVPCPHGYIFVGRWWNTRTAANGTNTGNDSSYAHCYLGGEGDPLTSEGKQAMRAVFDMAVATGAGDGRWSHSNWKATACPGGAIRDWIKNGMFVPQEPQPEPAPGGATVYSPPLHIDVAASLTSPQGGAWLLAPDGAIYAFGNAVYHGACNGKSYFSGRTAKTLHHSGDGRYIIEATSGERYGPDF